MKVRLLVFVMLLFVPVLVYAEHPISPRLDSMQWYVVDNLMRTSLSGTSQASQDRMYRSISSGIDAVCRDFPAICKLDTIVLAEDSVGACLPDDFLRVAYAFRDSVTSRLPLQEVAADTLWRLKDNVQDRGAWSSPKYFYTHGQRFFTHPKFIAGIEDTFFVFYYATDARLTGVSDSTDVLPQFRRHIVTFATAEMLRLLGKPQKAALYRAEYDYAVAQQRVTGVTQ